MGSFTMTLQNDWEAAMAKEYAPKRRGELNYDQKHNSINKFTKPNFKRRVKKINELIAASEVIAKTKDTTTYRLI